MSTWKQSVALTLLDALEWYSSEAKACADPIESGKYLHECTKIAAVLMTVLKVQLLSRQPTLLELAALKGEYTTMSPRTHEALLLCRSSLIGD